MIPYAVEGQILTGYWTGNILFFCKIERYFTSVWVQHIRFYACNSSICLNQKYIFFPINNFSRILKNHVSLKKKGQRDAPMSGHQFYHTWNFIFFIFSFNYDRKMRFYYYFFPIHFCIYKLFFLRFVGFFHSIFYVL